MNSYSGKKKLKRANCIALLGAILAFWGKSALAQSKIVPDGTLGDESSQVIPNAGSLPVEVINGGAQRGTNLFHSFSEFNISEGRGAYFANPAGIANILSRVTGSNPSEILGTLGVLSGNANLFLINPNGIIFGKNARLDVAGSFVGTTANEIGLSNGDIFSTNPVEPLPNQLLNVNPNAFFFNQLEARPIINRSSLAVQPGNSLLLVGGDVRLEGGQLTAPGGQVELGGLKNSGAVELNFNGNNLNLDFPEDVTRADVLLTDNSVVDVINPIGSSGSIAVNAQNVDILEASILFAGELTNLGNLGSVSSQAGNVEINATDKVTILGVDNTANTTFPNLGFPNIFTDSVETLGFIPSGILNVGSGNIVINAGFLEINKGLIVSTTLLEGNSGNIYLNATNSISVNDGILGTSSLLGQGDSGDITVKAGNRISFEGQRSAVVSVGGSLPSLFSGDSQAKSGNITIEARSLFLKEGAGFSSGTLGLGDAGKITLKVSDLISLDDSFINSGVGSPLSEGNAAEIDIQTRKLSLINGGRISSPTTGIGDAGKIQINASESVNISGVSELGIDASVLNFVGIEISDIFGFEADLPGYSSGIFTSTGQTASGQGGEIRVTTDNLRIADGGVLSARTRNVAKGGNIFVNANTVEATGGGQILTTAFSSGDAGNITLEATESVILSGSDPTFFDRLDRFGPEIVNPDGSASGFLARTRGEGAAGDLNITTSRLQVLEGAEVTVSSLGLESGVAGNLNVTAESIGLNERGKLIAETEAGQGGNINLQNLDLLLLRNNSLISTTAGTAGAGGDGGNIKIDTDFIVASPLENNDIIANAFEGKGGTIDITTQGIFGLKERRSNPPNKTNDIDASSEFGTEGTVEINTPDIDPNRGLIQLPTRPLETEVAQACAPGSTQRQSEFFITGRGGLPPDPNETLSSDAIGVDLVTLDSDAAGKIEGHGDTKTRRHGEDLELTMRSYSPSQVPHQIVEAQGIIVDENGDVVLVASAPNTSSSSSWQNQPDCYEQ